MGDKDYCGGKCEVKQRSIRYTACGKQRIIGDALEYGSMMQLSATEVSFYNLLELQTYLAAQTGRDRFAGVVLIADGDRVVFERAYGFANAQRQVLNRIDTRFNIGSLNKLFTSVAVLQLAERGLLGLDDRLADFRDDFPADVAERVTVRDLLRHQSGWGAYWDHPTFLAGWRSLHTIDDYIDFIKDIPLEFEPGSRQLYSNIGFEVLGAIVERVSGHPYHQYVAEHVCRPANLTATTMFESDDGDGRRAVGMSLWPLPGSNVPAGSPRANIDFPLTRGTAAGGGYSTADDLFSFGFALRCGKLLDAKSMALLFNGFEDGASLATLRHCANFAGGAPGINAFLAIDLGSDYTVVVLVNRDPPLADKLGIDILNMLQSLSGRT